MIDSLLVANRGEIAVRVFATCRRLGIRTIAVYSDADAHALHVAQADTAMRIGPPPAAASYLNGAAIIQAARESRAAAIHPGYGFLSENADFGQAVIDAGFVWVGPPPVAMRRLGDKARAKALAEQYDVPLLPGYHGEDQSPDTLRSAAERIGYPLLIKASSGGGGRGMRVVETTAAFSDALEAARREARASFGDDRVLLERYVRRPRHVEIQIVGDQHGHLVHLGERECSIQRRHQKLIEESPSPAVDANLRQRMGDAALRLARAAGYANAGTVEFLLDEQRQFAFLEVNARLQVEHPVTELVTGLDLVEMQLRVAAGEPLVLTQAEVRFSGHAIEARVIAEDALVGFLPSSGRIHRFEHPDGVRVDAGVVDGTDVSPYYDSLLAKIIAHATDRPGCVTKLARALQATWIDGVADNVDLLLASVEHPSFRAGDLHTGFLDEQHLIESLGGLPAPVLAAASAVDALVAPTGDPWRSPSTWRVGRLDQLTSWVRAGREHAARVSGVVGHDAVEIQSDGDVLVARLLADDPAATAWRLTIDGEAVRVWDRPDRRLVEWRRQGFRLAAPRALTIEQTAREHGLSGRQGRLVAPMPARVVKVAVKQGEHVRQNQPLVVLEAMKMEHVVEAPHAAVVTELCVAPGDQVQSGARLLTLGSADAHTVE